MAEKEFKEVLSGKKIPILILDHKWHRLLKETGENKEMGKLKEELSALVKRQGQLTSELKDMKKLKSTLMDEIVSNMEGVEGKDNSLAHKRVEDSKRLINEINEKTEAYQDELIDLPRNINEVNNRLMVLTMERCYSLIKDNTREIEEIGDWIKSMRLELKTNILKKQRMEVVNVELYSFMQDIFGPEVVDLFDITYDIEAKKQAFLEKKEAMKEAKKG